MHTVIVSAGPLDPDWLKKQLADDPADCVIAADAGYLALRDAGILPDILLGDLDSLAAGRPEACIQEEEGRAGSFEVYASRKDFTDTEAAIRRALSDGADRITLYGATGGRLDHFLANISCLRIALGKGCRAVIKDRLNEIELIDRDTVLVKEETFGTYVSLLPFTGEVRGVTLTGFEYPLTDAVLTTGNSLGVSNRIREDKAEIRLASGILILVRSKDRDSGEAEQKVTA